MRIAHRASPDTPRGGQGRRAGRLCGPQGGRVYWCHHPVCLGIRVAASAKVLTCAQEDDVCVLYASGKGRDMARDATRTYLARTLAHGLLPRVFLCIDANRRAR